MLKPTVFSIGIVLGLVSTHPAAAQQVPQSET